MKNISKKEENKILELAGILEKRGQEWLDKVNDDDYIKKNRPVLEIYTENKCQIHYSRELEWKRRKVPFLWYGKETLSMLKIPITSCKYCQKLFLPLEQYNKFKDRGEFLCKLVKEGILISDLTTETIKERSEQKNVVEYLCRIDKEDMKYLLNIVKMRAEIPIVLENGKIEYDDIPVYYSKNTGCHYIYSETMRRLKEKGVVLCRIIDATKMAEDQNSFKNLNLESDIHQYGYNVSYEENLSDIQRQTILCNLLNTNIVTLEELKNHLSFLININKSVWKMRWACLKWREDFEYLDNLEKGVYHIIKPEKLYVKTIIVK